MSAPAQRALIVGASAGIGRALASELARRGYALVLAARDHGELQRLASDLALRHGVSAEVVAFDVGDIAAHARWLEACGDLDVIALCHGAMADQLAAQRDFSEVRRMIELNYAACVSLLELAAPRFVARGRGVLCAVSSVAGDRGRQSNYLYGSTKAALSAYLQGLRNRLAPSGVHVLTVKPGFVDTGMTWGLVNAGSPLVASPERVARDIARALERRVDVLYTPFYWRFILLILRAIPERVFKRLKT
ncbi:MAG TPA: SDR family oxidoreductase [Myxococcota bacterium]|jgi:short-subunit dehydrogenase